MYSSRKYLCPPQGRLMEIPRGRGVSKAQFFEGKYDTKMEFPEGWGVQFKKPSMGRVWIFSGTTQSMSALIFLFHASHGNFCSHHMSCINSFLFCGRGWIPRTYLLIYLPSLPAQSYSNILKILSLTLIPFNPGLCGSR